jgi:hypothetical protein
VVRCRERVPHGRPGRKEISAKVIERGHACQERIRFLEQRHDANPPAMSNRHTMPFSGATRPVDQAAAAAGLVCCGIKEKAALHQSPCQEFSAARPARYQETESFLKEGIMAEPLVFVRHRPHLLQAESCC